MDLLIFSRLRQTLIHCLERYDIYEEYWNLRPIHVITSRERVMEIFVKENPRFCDVTMVTKRNASSRCGVGAQETTPPPYECKNRPRKRWLLKATIVISRLLAPLC